MEAFPLIFARFLIYALYIVLLGRVLMSFVNPRMDGPVGRFIFETTEPFLAPIRRVLPQGGMLDFSPLVAFLVLSLLLSVIGRG
ncbi:MAG: YggT family protein [Candidatus Limnocylindrales bacterium]